jgi:hypothetical protein
MRSAASTEKMAVRGSFLRRNRMKGSVRTFCDHEQCSIYHTLIEWEVNYETGVHDMAMRTAIAAAKGEDAAAAAGEFA